MGIRLIFGKTLYLGVTMDSVYNYSFDWMVDIISPSAGADEERDTA